MPTVLECPPEPLRVVVSPDGMVDTAAPTLVRRISELEGLYEDGQAWTQLVAAGDPVVYTVQSSPVPEVEHELPLSTTTILPGTCAGEFFMTKGHQHVNPEGEIYLGLSGVGGLLLFDGGTSRWIDMAPGVIGYIPPVWAHRSVNVGTEPYRFLAVYPGRAGHDYQWVLGNGLGLRAFGARSGFELRPQRALR